MLLNEPSLNLYLWIMNIIFMKIYIIIEVALVKVAVSTHNFCVVWIFLKQFLYHIYCDLSYLRCSLKINSGPGKLQMFGSVDHLREALCYQIFWIFHAFIVFCYNVSYFWIVLRCLNWLKMKTGEGEFQCCWVHNSGVA